MSFKGELEFDGEYLNGKRNGKGKEYCDDDLIFDGEYLNGKRRIEQIQKRQKYLNETDSLKAEKSTFNSTQTPTKIDELNFTLQSFLKKNQDLNNNSNIENNYNHILFLCHSFAHLNIHLQMISCL